jgi:hypothetical protein
MRLTQQQKANILAIVITLFGMILTITILL